MNEPTNKSAVELEESTLDQVAGGAVSKIEALTIKQKVTVDPPEPIRIEGGSFDAAAQKVQKV